MRNFFSIFISSYGTTCKKWLSYCRETALQVELVLAKVED